MKKKTKKTKQNATKIFYYKAPHKWEDKKNT